MDPGTELIALQARHQQLLREHAVLEAREAEKARHREEIRTQLRAAGVNPDDPEKELIRLATEAEAILAENKAQLDAFEAKLKAATQGDLLPVEDANPTEPTEPSAPHTKSEPAQSSAPHEPSEPKEPSAPKPVSEPPAPRGSPTKSEPRHPSAPNYVSEPQVPSAPRVTSEPKKSRAPVAESEPPEERGPKPESAEDTDIEIF